MGHRGREGNSERATAQGVRGRGAVVASGAVLAYNDLSRCHDTLALAGGRCVRLVSLSQEQTYLGLIEGVPRRKTNDLQVAAASERGVLGSPVHVVPPRRRDWLRTPGDCAEMSPLLGMPPEWLPLVACVGLWESAPTGRDADADRSRLTVAWWQDDYAMPIDGAALDAIRALDWEALARDDSAW